MPRPRLRSLFRIFTLALVVLVVLVLAASLALRLYGRHRLSAAREAFERQGFSLALASYELPPVPKTENAAAWLTAGASAIVWSADDQAFAFGASDTPVATWNVERTRRVRALVDSNRGALDTLHRGDSLPAASFEIPYREGDAARLPDLMALRRASTLMLLEGRLATLDHDRTRVVRSVAGLARLAEALWAESTLVAPLLGTAVDDHLTGLGAELAVAPTPWLAESHGFEAVLTAMSTGDRRGRLRRAFAYEAAALSDWLGRGSPLTGDAAGDAAWRRLRLLCGVTGWTKLAQAAVLDASVQELSLVDTALPLSRTEEPRRPSWRLLLVHRRIAETLTRSAPRVLLSARSSLAQRQIVRAALVLRGLEASSKAYPPDRPAEAGLDEANPLTGQPLRYVVEADGSARVEIPGVTPDLLKSLRRGAVLTLTLPKAKELRTAQP